MGGSSDGKNISKALSSGRIWKSGEFANDIFAVDIW